MNTFKWKGNFESNRGHNIFGLFDVYQFLFLIQVKKWESLLEITMVYTSCLASCQTTQVFRF